MYAAGWACYIVYALWQNFRTMAARSRSTCQLDSQEASWKQRWLLWLQNGGGGDFEDAADQRPGSSAPPGGGGCGVHGGAAEASAGAPS
eukprot:CAMPEP_0175787306 /NCGR_PEP_ID=MMETSP0097-20121207/80283_1 /TAXON_ID=311494 /ORGANISM="Alexandrium monilatum, Strain CCMP3105" /LENGTH=88 /DNA_ID=CAMNT_0017098259 /DNA_START=1 /DNA_END=263 /DNA_ORIENTATION=-